MTETFVAVEPSQNDQDDAPAAAIDVPRSREVDNLKSPGSWCARPERPALRSPGQADCSRQ